MRLYSDTRPHYYHIAGLQKGLILVKQGAELVGEGTGFGVPVVRYRDKTYFSGSSTLRISQTGNSTTLVKKFVLDMIHEIRFRKTRIENKITRRFAKFLAELYEKHKRWRLLFLHSLLKRAGIQSLFVQVKPAGKVTVIYRIDPPFIHVKALFELWKKEGLQKIFLLNEQGSRFFRKYCDSNCTVLFDKHIGTWDAVEAEWACVFSKSGEFGFCLRKVEDTVLHRGREFLEGILDWVGLDYEFSPHKTCFEYDIELFGASKDK